MNEQKIKHEFSIKLQKIENERYGHKRWNATGLGYWGEGVTVKDALHNWMTAFLNQAVDDALEHALWNEQSKTSSTAK